MPTRKDVAGIVTHAAADGSGPEASTRIVAHLDHSGWARRAAVPTDRLVELPADVPFDTAAALPLAGLTALRLARMAGLSAGTNVLMTGASGGVGHYLAELAAAAGAQLTAVVGSIERGSRLRNFGATTILETTETTETTEATRPFDVGLDLIGGSSLATVRRLVSPTGRLIWFGQASREPATSTSSTGSRAPWPHPFASSTTA